MRGSLKGLLCLLIVAMMLAACGPASSSTPNNASDTVVTSERCGDPSRLSKSVSFYNWGDYIDPDVLTLFKEECGVDVIYDTFSSNEDLLAKLQGGASGYDLIVPSDYMVQIMIQLDLLKELDHANIPNMSHLDADLVDAPYDPGNVYTIPYMWGVAGLGYDADKLETPPTSLAVIFDPAQAEAHAGKLSFLNDSREVIGAALKYLGYSMNSTDPAQLEEAKQTILAIKPYILTFDSDTYSDIVVSGETVISHGWNGGFAVAISENPDRNLGFVVPEEGLTIFTDNFAIPKTAPNAYTAEVLINFLNEPEIAARLSEATMYASANEGALEFLSDEIKNNPGIYPSQDALANTEYIMDVGEATALYERIWTEIKAQ